MFGNHITTATAPRPGGFVSPQPRPALTLVAQAKPVTLPPVIGDRELLAQNTTRARIVLLRDCSGSEYAPGGDQAGFRMAAGRSLLRAMRRTGGGYLAIVNWGSRPTLRLDLTEVRTGYAVIDHALSEDPGSMGGNDFPAALTMARAILAPVPANAIPLVIGITDGLEDITPAMHNEITALPTGSVHMLMVPGHSCNDALAAQWQSLPIASFTRLPLDNNRLAVTIGSIYAGAIGGLLNK